MSIAHARSQTRPRPARTSPARALLGGGTDGNERLTAATAVILVVAVLLISDFGAWTSTAGTFHHFR